MGLSRYDPHARKRWDRADWERQQEREQYLNSLTSHQKRAQERVLFCLCAVGKLLDFDYRGAAENITTKELSSYFPRFAKAMGWRGPFYKATSGACRAVSIAYPDNGPDRFWIIVPYSVYKSLDENSRKEFQTENVRSAALDFCKAWLPTWKWDNVPLW